MVCSFIWCFKHIHVNFLCDVMLSSLSRTPCLSCAARYAGPVDAAAASSARSSRHSSWDLKMCHFIRPIMSFQCSWMSCSSRCGERLIVTITFSCLMSLSYFCRLSPTGHSFCTNPMCARSFFTKHERPRLRCEGRVVRVVAWGSYCESRSVRVVVSHFLLQFYRLI